MEQKPKLTAAEIIAFIDIELADLEQRKLTEANLGETIREVEDLKQWLGKIGLKETVALDCELLSGDD